jgi:hypothetical protein
MYPMRGPGTRIDRLFSFLQEASANFTAYLVQRVRSTGASAPRSSVGHEWDETAPEIGEHLIYSFKYRHIVCKTA